MLAPSGDRAVPASLNCLIFVSMKCMVMMQEIVSAIRGRMLRNLGRMSWTVQSKVIYFFNSATWRTYVMLISLFDLQLAINPVTHCILLPTQSRNSSYVGLNIIYKMI